ncbi:MAG: hypothetical protein GX061_09250 [Eubacteriaceae bacterium]|nr:hypothetical protein [Eubacteriaceae bacterium]
MSFNEARKVYKEYQKCVSVLEGENYFEKCGEAWRFYQGDQWKGLKSPGDMPPILNILSPIVDHKVARIAQNGMSITYTPLEMGRRYPVAVSLCRRFTDYARGVWEALKLDREIWNFATQSAVCGDSFVYFHYENGQIKMTNPEGTDIFLADEYAGDLQSQKFIIIAQRKFTEDIRTAGEAEGLEESELSLILPEEGERKGENILEGQQAQKTLCLLKMWKEADGVHFLECTKNVVFRKERVVNGLDYYPIAQFTWKRQRSSARGLGEIYPRIPNQIEINKALARYLAVIRNCAYPHVVYNRQVVNSSEEVAKLLNTVGSVIGLDSPRMQRTQDVISYLEPAQINPAALNIIDELITRTKDLAGAGEAATGAINPEMASGAAIIAVRDEAALPLNNQQAHLKQFAEDIAMIWLSLLRAYNPETLIFEERGPAGIPMAEEIPAALAADLKVSCGVDISPKNPYSRYAQEQALQNLLSGGYITFEEYVASLDDDSAAPKGKLTQIVKTREQKALASGLFNDSLSEGRYSPVPAEEAIGGEPMREEEYGI